MDVVLVGYKLDGSILVVSRFDEMKEAADFFRRWSKLMKFGLHPAESRVVEKAGNAPLTIAEIIDGRWQLCI